MATTKKSVKKSKSAPKKAIAKRSNTTKSTKVGLKKAPMQAPKVAKLTPPKAAYKQSEFFDVLASQSDLTRKQVKNVLENIQTIAKIHLVKNGPGEFTLPGLLKIKAVVKPAKKARKGINPFTGEETTFKAKPASRALKIKPLKRFKSEIE